MLADIFSVFDDNNSTLFSCSSFMWLSSGFVFLSLFSSLWVGISRFQSSFLSVKNVAYSVLMSAKGRGMGGFSLIIIGLFFMIIVHNLLGLLPYVFSMSSHLAWTVSLALPLWFSLIVSSIFWNYYSFVAHFLPLGAPSGLNFFLVVIETISISVRPLTLSVRLAANMSAGHIVLSLLGGFFSVSLLNMGVSGVMFYLFSSFYFVFEMAICLIQGYIFVLLLMLYSDEHS